MFAWHLEINTWLDFCNTIYVILCCAGQVLLNHETGSAQAAPTEPGAPELMRLSRLKLAIKLRQKKVRSSRSTCRDT